MVYCDHLFGPLDEEPFCSLCFLTYDEYEDGLRVEIHTSPNEAPVVVPIPMPRRPDETQVREILVTVRVFYGEVA